MKASFNDGRGLQLTGIEIAVITSQKVQIVLKLVSVVGDLRPFLSTEKATGSISINCTCFELNCT